MEYREYLNKKVELYDALFGYIEEENDNDYNYQDLIETIQYQKICENREELTEFLLILLHISNNHHRFPHFIDKIKHVIQYFFNSIKQTFTNFEIFNLFKSNKLIVLFLIRHKIINIDRNIVLEMIYRSSAKCTKYHYFFYPEIKEFLDEKELIEVEEEIKLTASNTISIFEKNREIGENENYICELIRNDSVIDFISYVNKKNLPLFNTKIKASVFETNSLLNKREPTLIEYAVFYGSIEIFQYLKLNNAEMKLSLWFYAIHGRNAELIHLLEEYFINPPNYIYKICFNESVKCHHNDIANYFKDQYLNSNEDQLNYKSIFQYYNYEQFPKELKDDNYFFYYLCKYRHPKLVKLYLKLNMENKKLNFEDI